MKLSGPSCAVRGIFLICLLLVGGSIPVYTQTNDSFPALKFEDITEAEFRVYANSYLPQLNQDLGKIVVTDTTFSFQTAKSTFTFNRQFEDERYINRHGYRWANYNGYIKSLELYVLEDVSNGEFTLGNLFLIDSLSGERHDLSSNSDYSFRPPLVSPHQRYFAVYLNDLLSDPVQGVIELHAIDRTKGQFSYRKVSGNIMDGKLIEELIWIDDQSIALKINEQRYNDKSGEMENQFRYARSTIGSGKTENE